MDDLGENADGSFVCVEAEQVRAEKAKARALRTSQWWKNLRGRGECYYCRKRFHPRELTMDHIVPLVRGGKTTRSNVVPSCKECNNSKRYLLPVEWEDYLRRLAGPLEHRARHPPE